MKIDLFGSKGQSWDDAISAIECENWIPEKSTDKSGLILRQMYGCSQYYHPNDDAGDMIYDIYAVNVRYEDFTNRLYYIWYSGFSSVWEMRVYWWNGSAMQNSNVGTLTGASGSFSNMIHDASKQGGKVIVGDKEANTIYVVTMNNTPSSDAVAAYTMPTGWEVQSLTYQDGFFLGSIKDSGTNEERRKVIQSDFGASTFTSTNFYTRTSGPGNVLKVLSDNRETWVFCEDAIEVLYNAGNSGFSFSRNNSVYIEIGLLSENTVVKFDNTIIFMGISPEGQAGIYMMNGYTPVDITPIGLKETMSSTNLKWRENAYGHPIKMGNNELYVFNSEQSILATGAWAYDLKNNSWFQPGHSEYWPFYRGYAYFTTRTSSSTINQYNVLVNYDSINATTGAVTNTDDMSYINPSVYTAYIEATAANDVMERRAVSRHIYSEDNNLLIHNRVELEFKPATNLAVRLRYSDDDGSTWTTVSTITASDGKYRWSALGAARDRIYEIYTATNVEATLISAWVLAKGLSN